MTRVHILKAWPAPFDLVWLGVKPFEIRKNDRGFSVDDVLVIRRYHPDSEHFDGRTVIARISCVTSGWGIPRGTVVLGLAQVSRHPKLTCPCETEIEDLGGEHLPRCEYRKPEYGTAPF